MSIDNKKIVQRNDFMDSTIEFTNVCRSCIKCKIRANLNTRTKRNMRATRKTPDEEAALDPVPEISNTVSSETCSATTAKSNMFQARPGMQKKYRR
mmetsp:Transcript_2367/g.3693  ORF Transcript_2367/g.3693 Transcript_2367/m.3693 type:complete len:96 (-) Transcript_2367:60-347(-)